MEALRRAKTWVLAEGLLGDEPCGILLCPCCGKKLVALPDQWTGRCAISCKCGALFTVVKRNEDALIVDVQYESYPREGEQHAS